MASPVVPVPHLWQPHHGILHGHLEADWRFACANDAGGGPGVHWRARNDEAKAPTTSHCRNGQRLPPPEYDCDIVGVIETGRMEPHG
jgi:hypothetical protein